MPKTSVSTFIASSNGGFLDGGFGEAKVGDVGVGDVVPATKPREQTCALTQ